MRSRLWVRLSLVFCGVMVMMIIIPPLFLLLYRFDLTGGQLSEFGQFIESVESQTFQEAQFARMQSLMIYILLIAGLVGTTVGAVVSRSLTKPLDQLKDGAEAVSRQEFSTRVPEDGTQELKAVAVAFNSMAAQLESAEQLRRNLLSDVAHELRHPLHVIRGNLEALLDGVFPLEMTSLERLRGQTDLLTTLIDDLHELAQAEAQQLQLYRQPVLLPALIDQVVETFQSRATAQDIYLERVLLGKLPPVDADPIRLQQVLYNLLENGLRHTPRGGQIEILAEATGEEVVLRICDSGAGIDPDALPHIFDRFYRTDKARRRDSGGSGLGLAIVKALVEAHGGEVGVESPGAGQGSTFWIRLPVAELNEL